MAIDWKSKQIVAITPYDDYRSSSANKLLYAIDEDGKGVIFGLEISKQDDTTLKITQGVCIQSTTVIKFKEDILLPLNETNYLRGMCYAVVRFKYIETRIEQFHHASIDIISQTDYDPEWHLILGTVIIDLDSNTGNDFIQMVDEGGRELSDTQNHNHLNDLQGGNGIDEYYHLTRAQHDKIEQLFGDGTIDHNTELTGLEGGDGTHFIHLSQAQADYLDNLMNGSGGQYVLKTGDSMTGELNMNGHKITSLANATSSGDAVNLGQLNSIVNSLIDDSATDANHAWSAEKIISWVATHGGSGGSGFGGAGISDPLRITVNTTSTHTVNLAYDNTQIFFVEPDNITDRSGNEFEILRNGVNVRVCKVNDILELRRKSDKVLAATLKLHEDKIEVTLGTNIDNPPIIFTYFESAVDDTFWDQFIKVDGTTSPQMNINWANHKITNLADPTNDQDAATKKYVDTKVSNVDLSNYLRKDGSNSPTNDIWWNNHRIGGLGNPVNDHDAVNYITLKNKSLLVDGSNQATNSLNLGNHRIYNLADPTNDQDAATKKYVDNKIGNNLSSLTLINDYIMNETVPHYTWRYNLNKNDDSPKTVNISSIFNAQKGGLLSIFWWAHVGQYNEKTDCNHGDEGRVTWAYAVYFAALYYVNVSMVYDSVSYAVRVNFIPIATATQDPTITQRGFHLNMGVTACRGDSKTSYDYSLVNTGNAGRISASLTANDTWPDHLTFKFYKQAVNQNEWGNLQGHSFLADSDIYMKWVPLYTQHPLMFWRRKYLTGWQYWWTINDDYTYHD